MQFTNCVNFGAQCIFKFEKECVFVIHFYHDLLSHDYFTIDNETRHDKLAELQTTLFSQAWQLELCALRSLCMFSMQAESVSIDSHVVLSVNN